MKLSMSARLINRPLTANYFSLLNSITLRDILQLFINSSVEEHLSHFPVFSITNKGALNIYTQVFV